MDIFQFLTHPNVAVNNDTIIDFSAADDTIQLDDLYYYNFGATGPLAAGMFNTGTAPTEADDRIIYNTATGALLYDWDGSGVFAIAIQFATLAGAPVISAADFVVI